MNAQQSNTSPAVIFPAESPAYFPVSLTEIDVPGFDARGFQAVVRKG